MYADESPYDYHSLVGEASGSPDRPQDYKIISYPFGKYIIKVKVTQDNEFIGIAELAINRDFLSHKQRLSSHRFHDVDEFYRE